MPIPVVLTINDLDFFSLEVISDAHFSDISSALLVIVTRHNNSETEIVFR